MQVELTNIGSNDARIEVVCYHELNGPTRIWPPEIEGIRRRIKADLAETNIPEIVRGDFAYWLWDRWIFCAGYAAQFKFRGDSELLDSVNLMDSGGVATSITKEKPLKLSLIVGSELHQNMKRIGYSANLGTDLPPPPTPLVVEVAGGSEGIISASMSSSPPLEGADQTIREQFVKDSARILISMRVRGDQPLSSSGDPAMIFAPSEGAHHKLKRNGGKGPQYATLAELEAFEGTEDLITVGVEYVSSTGNTVVLKYKLRSATLAALAAKLGDRCKDIARTYSRWPLYRRTPNRSAHLVNSCDLQFRTQYCVISGIYPVNKGIIEENVMRKLRRATAGMTTRVKADEKWLTNIKSRHMRLLRISDLGWAQLPKERMFALIKLESSIMVGVSMLGGTPRTERIEVGSENSDLPEYYTRQFVTEAEAAFLKEVEKKVGSDPGVNTIMRGVRGLQRLGGSRTSSLL
jgi:hypothetical protein